MKILCCVLALILALAKADASVFELTGSLSWKITEPRLTFSLVGGLVNHSAGTSGTIKMVLWASPYQYPPTAPTTSTAYNVGEYTLGQINGGSEFHDFSVRTHSYIPSISGNYYFTIAIVEYTAVGWRNVLFIPGVGTKNLIAGNFSDQLKWVIPTGTVIAPIATLSQGQIINLTEKATDQLNLYPAGSQDKSSLTILVNPHVNVTNPTGTRAAGYTYNIKSSVVNNKTVSGGETFINYSSSNDQDTITLYFLKPKSGYYQSMSSISGYTETIWGRFTLP